MEPGARLRAEREDRGWSRSQLAGRLRSAPGGGVLPEVRQLVDMVRQWERGDHAPGVDYRSPYCHVFGISEDMLFVESRGTRSPLLVGENGPVAPLPGIVPFDGGAALGISGDGTSAEDLSARVHALRLADDVRGSAPRVRPVTERSNRTSRGHRRTCTG